jgi:pimeloyl-ACP methyl ester carboxylesterase
MNRSKLGAVSIVQNPTLSLADDVAVTKRTLATQNGAAILVGYSYGGAVIIEAGNDPKVAGLVLFRLFGEKQRWGSALRMQVFAAGKGE